MAWTANVVLFDSSFMPRYIVRSVTALFSFLSSQCSLIEIRNSCPAHEYLEYLVLCVVGLSFFGFGIFE